jgi:hypothetical protein
MKANCKTGAAWFLVGALVMGLAQLDNSIRPASAQGGAQAATHSDWEYKTESIEATTIQAKLTEFGAAGWEVFSVESTNRALENADTGTPHIVTQRFEITAKRAKK